MTSKEAMLETDTEFHVRLITFEISARQKVSKELLRINIKGIKKPRPKGIKHIIQ